MTLDSRDNWAIAVDVGGTFTDMALYSENQHLKIYKVPSNPKDPSEGVLRALEHGANKLNLSLGELLTRCHTFIHGSTVATNTMRDGKRAKVGLLTTKGFRDSLEIRRGMRDNVWDHRAPFAPVLVPRSMRLGVEGRINAAGEETMPLNEAQVIEQTQALIASGAESLCIAFLHAYKNDRHEQRAKTLIQDYLHTNQLTLEITLSSEVSPLIGEYGRTSTAVVNAALLPLVSGYLSRLKTRLAQEGLATPLLMQQSNGGVIPLDYAIQFPVSLLLSGPSAVVGALHYLSALYETNNLLSLEIGGTSTDVTILNNGVSSVAESLNVAGYLLTVPAVDIHTIAAGGGSIASADEIGMIQVGPEGAGADPGPAAFSLGGTRPTLTDIHLIQGRLKEGEYANGFVTLDKRLAIQALETHITDTLGISLDNASYGIMELANQHVRHAVEKISVERGIDVRNFALVAGGGAGPMHGAAIARALNIPTMIVPRHSGVLCALGMLNGNVQTEFILSCAEPLSDSRMAAIDQHFERLAKQAHEFLETLKFDTGRRRLQKHLKLRYANQLWEVTIAADDGTPNAATLRERFEAAYQQLYAHIQPEGHIEISTVQVTAIGLLAPLKIAPQTQAQPSASPASYRRIFFENTGWIDAVPIYQGSDIAYGFRATGPLIVEEATTTIVVPPEDEIEMSPTGDYLIHITGAPTP